MSIRKVLFRVFVCLGLGACLWLAVIGISPQTGLYPLAKTRSCLVNTREVW